MRQITPVETMGWRMVPETMQGHTRGIGIIYNAAGTRLGAWDPYTSDGDWNEDGGVICLFTPQGLKETDQTATDENDAVLKLRDVVPDADRVTEPVEADDLKDASLKDEDGKDKKTKQKKDEAVAREREQNPEAPQSPRE